MLLNRPLNILTNVMESRCSTEWQRRTDFRPEGIGGKGLLSDIIAALRLLHLSKYYDIAIVSSNRSANLFAILSRFLPYRNKIPILMIDCLWYKPNSMIMLWIKRIQILLMSLSVDQFVVWASCEVRDYATTFFIPQKKLLHIPHHHTLEGYEFIVSEGDYIFSGGTNDRDYLTLIEAVKGLGQRVVIATLCKDWCSKTTIPEGIEIISTSHEDFRRWMANSKIVVVSLKKGLLHIGGQQTYLNAMAMGKPVVVADDKGAMDYIEDGVNGIIVPAGDAVALRAAILSLIEHPDTAIKIADNAKETYYRYSTPQCIQTILQVAEGIVAVRNNHKVKGH